jgi:hypothetical protein
MWRFVAYSKLCLKGTGSRDRIQIFWRKWLTQGLLFFYNFDDLPLMSSCLCHFSHGWGKSIWENYIYYEILLYIIIILLNMSNTNGIGLKSSNVVFAICHTVEVKAYGKIIFIVVRCKLLSGYSCFLLIHGVNSWFPLVYFSRSKIIF